MLVTHSHASVIIYYMIVSFHWRVPVTIITIFWMFIQSSFYATIAKIRKECYAMHCFFPVYTFLLCVHLGINVATVGSWNITTWVSRICFSIIPKENYIINPMVNYTTKSHLKLHNLLYKITFCYKNKNKWKKPV